MLSMSVCSDKELKEKFKTEVKKNGRMSSTDQILTGR